MTGSSQVEVLTSVRNLALLKLGRNIYNFGLVERWLKYIVTVSDVTVIGSTSGPMIDSKTKKKIGKTQKMMLGQLINEVFQLWAPEEDIFFESQDLFNIRLKNSIKIEMLPKDYQTLKASYETMLYDRNFLIHHFDEKFILSSADNCYQAISYLDEMREKHILTIQNLQEVIKTYLELVKEVEQAFE